MNRPGSPGAPVGGPLFLARESYRRRRLMDAARMLPYAGIFLFGLPVFLSEDARTTRLLVFIFAVWAVLIAIGFILGRLLDRPDVPAPLSEDPASGGNAG